MGTGAGCGLVGSSPLTRGKRRRGLRGRRVGRLIPAHAGKTRDGLRYSSGHPAHPRSRGENTPRPFTASHRAGSSPLTRGKRGDAASVAMLQRLIPAHAGKTNGDAHPGRVEWAHPRSRGENVGRWPGRGGRWGSSPLTRGKRPTCRYCPATRRLIPAHAGKTRGTKTWYQVFRAHPRSRGENRAGWSATAKRWGSSPLTRGKPSSIACLRRLSRLIPAHAGKTRGLVGHHEALGAHPRSRGENARRTRDLLGC